MTDPGVTTTSWVPASNGAKCPRCGTPVWVRSVWEPLIWYWQWMCPECRAQGPGQRPDRDRAAIAPSTPAPVD